MKNFICALFILLAGCAGSPLKTSVEAENNQIQMADLYKGMKERQVLETMGKPYKVEQRTYENTTYHIWYYITKQVQLGQSRLIHKNFTPLIFKNGILIGWGYDAYDYLFDVDETRRKYLEEKRQQYTDDDDEWPSDKVYTITPTEKKATPEENKPEEPVQKPVEKAKEKDSCGSGDDQHPNYHFWD
ncbi:MAG TPA: DUF3192 domain-containing protein [Chlamydiales bacterium]|nr:DUF3192 domain-containing protein [Chlamydiales bacterium]